MVVVRPENTSRFMGCTPWAVGMIFFLVAGLNRALAA